MNNDSKEKVLPHKLRLTRNDKSKIKFMRSKIPKFKDLSDEEIIIICDYLDADRKAREEAVAKEMVGLIMEALKK